VLVVILAAACWGAVMALVEVAPTFLPGLRFLGLAGAGAG